MVKRYSDLFLQARSALLCKEGDRAANCARELLAAASGKTPAAIVADRDIYAAEEVEQKLQEYVQRMLNDEPLAYVLGEWDFYGMTLQVTPDVLIPRDDTVAVTELAMEHALFLEKNPRILDLCSGSGCIGLAIARRVKDAHVVLGEIFPGAIRVAKRNIQNWKLGGRVTCMAIDARRPAMNFIGKFDLIVSNPPYITSAEMQTLEPSVRNFEPHLALDGGADGLDFYRSIPACFSHALKPNGHLCLEFGMGQEQAVEEILLQHGFEIVEWRRDAAGIMRAVKARKKEKDE